MTVSFIQYARVRDNHRKGIFAVNIDGSHVSIGWSLCATKRGDRFNRDFGLQIAEARREKRESLNFSIHDEIAISEARDEIPHSMTPTFDRIIDRCRRIVSKRITNENIARGTVNT